VNAARLASLAAAFAADKDALRRSVRDRRCERAQRLLTPTQVATLTEAQLRELFYDTDAFERWGNPAWAFDRRLREVGIDALKVSLGELATRARIGITRDDLDALWKRRGLGLLLSTELLAYAFPSRYWVLDSPRTLWALKSLGDDVKSALPRGARSDADVYLALAPRMIRVRDALVEAGVEGPDFVDAGVFLAWVAEREPERTQRDGAATSGASKSKRAKPVERETPYTSARAVERTVVAEPGESEAQLPLVAAASPEQARRTVERALEARGLRYARFQLASFYTALQVKGFVVLSGISGTGKTRLAQSFAELLPQPHTPRRGAAVPHDAVVLTVQPYMLATGRVLIPRQAARLFDPPVADEARDVTVVFDGRAESCPFVRASYAGRDYLSLSLRGEARRWFSQHVRAGDTVVLEPVLAHDDALDAFRITHGSEWLSSTPDEPQRNWLFVPVRPDWRDGRSLLGYFNPITRTYEWTPFLRFVLRANRGYRANDGLARFVILDEMNLAHVEHYLADVLSVLEAGRDDDGWTREGLQFTQPDDAEGDLPPRELKLPPSLYLVGTVNADETTHAFSPKVLDRAFVLDFGDADLGDYPPSLIDASLPDDAERLALLRSFSKQGRFARIDKAVIYPYVNERPALRARLATLHALLRPFDMHFGYRVYDEIVAFLEAAERNGWFDGVGDPLDAALCMKVLPRFRGQRRRLDAPLRALLAFCANPDAPSEAAIAEALESGPEDPAEALATVEFALEHAASAGVRLLRRLFTDGFAAFGA
jgi:energy-coupling factor transporter ATP-binding protein EcfA2